MSVEFSVLRPAGERPGEPREIPGRPGTLSGGAGRTPGGPGEAAGEPQEAGVLAQTFGGKKATKFKENQQN